MKKRFSIFFMLAFFSMSCTTSKIIISKPSAPAPFCIAIDAGHGGDDLGTKSGKTLEKDLNLKLAKLVKNRLGKKGIQTLLTRADDRAVPLKLRASFTNANHPKIFVSLHHNAAKNKKASGIEIYYYKDKSAKSSASHRLGKMILEEMTQATSAKSRGVKAGNFLVIRETNMPAVLIECGFLTHDREGKKLQDPAYQKKLASAIANGIEKYLLDYANS